MITQSNAKKEILKLWDEFGANYSNGIQFKQEKTRFENFLRENHKDLLDFRCQGGDPFFCMNFQRVDGWITEHTGYYK